MNTLIIYDAFIEMQVRAYLIEISWENYNLVLWELLILGTENGLLYNINNEMDTKLW